MGSTASLPGRRREDFAHGAAKARLDSLAKPPGSLGLLEDWAARLAALQHADWLHANGDKRSGRPALCSVRNPVLVLFAADHGSLKARPELSAYPQSVTYTIFCAIAAGVAASSALARANGVELELIDVGIDGETGVHGESGSVAASRGGGGTRDGVAQASHVRALVRKVGRGTADSSAGPAMTAAQCAASLAEGEAAVRRARTRDGGVAGQGCNVLLVGELGLGNTTSAAALLAALASPSSSASPADVTGSGTGVQGDALAAKAEFVASALRTNAALIRSEGARGALRAVGGYEIAAMAGAMLEARRLGGMAVLVDGFIAGAAALAAVRIEPSCARALFLSHRSAERGAALLVAELVSAGCAPPALDMGMRLGEGTGALVALGVLRSACAVLEMATLDEAVRLGAPSVA